jgi:hypothetical protein
MGIRIDRSRSDRRGKANAPKGRSVRSGESSLITPASRFATCSKRIENYIEVRTMCDCRNTRRSRAMFAEQAAFSPCQTWEAFISNMLEFEFAMEAGSGRLPPPSRDYVDARCRVTPTIHQSSAGVARPRLSEFSRQVAVDFQPNADFDEGGRCPGHRCFLSWVNIAAKP